MNAVDTSTVPAPAGGTHSTHPTNRFRLLLRREYWEHKGGFLWAPLIAGGISLALAVMAAIVGVVMLNRAAAAGDIQINGVDLGMLTREMSPSDAEQLALGLDWSLIMSSAWPFIVLTFVVFFYCLGALYDDRKDRSVLFWKSLPISDAQTVLSKVASAVVVAPVLAVLAAVVTMFGFLVLMSVMVMMFGGNPFTLLWAQSHPLRIAFGLLAWVPVYAVWALPTVGWLLLCSAWARSKPFLWATAVPVITGLLVTWFDIMELFQLDGSWFWRNVVGRLLLGTVPGSDVLYRTAEFGGNDIERAEQLLSLQWMYGIFLQPGTWIGAVAGAVMIYIAIRLRRWRDEG
ncbi:hypothetical protein [Novilysobacter defluvii]|uniref:Uncharacterized protein n=1 Tax=Lysobacter defluvii IMMIB APB-9 = DSM 18482 TaxID=1385515 RepID=A0A0A0M951_9GAMM|nr:hypothetical protein [Lysobacter defluvii]KGO99558.1 hypothetical protein N791_04285 [Lysobacter defluvii IMMIB APB-9 = DSM 18482]